MTPTQTIEYLKTLALTEALWWFIENHSETSVGYAETFFYLRERVRTEQDRMTRAVALIGVLREADQRTYETDAGADQRAEDVESAIAELCHFHYELEQGQ